MVTIRLAQDSDFAQLKVLYKELLHSEFNLGEQLRSSQGIESSPEKVNYNDLKTQMRNEKGCFLVACDGKSIVGYIYGYFDGEDYNDPSMKKAFLEALYVSEKYRRQGIGTRLVVEIESYFKERGCASIDVMHLHPNDGARKLYGSLGFIATMLKHNKRL